MGGRAARALALGAVLAALGLSASGGGALGAECLGDECQGPPPAPEEVIPGTAVVEGPANPPVRFPHQGKGSKGKKHQQAKKHHQKHKTKAGQR